jgi:hypothetical protein
VVADAASVEPRVLALGQENSAAKMSPAEPSWNIAGFDSGYGRRKRVDVI